MGSVEARRRLIVNADDFGRSPSINEAVIRAHREGILTTASLMVNGGAFTEAVELAKLNPQLGVGLHLTLVCGTSALRPERIPGLVGHDGSFSDNPVTAGMRYFFQRGLRDQLRAEIAAQLEKFTSTGLVLDHVNGHLNIHLHPVVFRLLMENARQWEIRRVRLTRDPLRVNLRLARGRYGYRLSHALTFGALARWARPTLERHGIQHTQAVFGLLQTGYLDESYFLGLIPELPAGDSELYSHPNLEEFLHEFEALVSPRVGQQLRTSGIELIRYQDL